MKWAPGIGCVVFTLLLSITLNVISAATLGTSVLTTAASVTLTESDYRFYSNADTLTPTSGLAAENTAAATPSIGTIIRLRMNILDTGVELSSGATFALQYSSATSSGWTDLTSSTAWTFSDNASVADGQVIATTLLSDSDVGGSYSESNPTAGSPNAIPLTQKGEWDWVIKNESAAATSPWYFRMIYSSSTPLDAYTNYPALTGQSTPTPPPGGGGGQDPVVPGTGSPLPVRPPLAPPRPQPPTAAFIVDRVDLNGDRRIDMRDFSILLYYFGRTGSEIRRYDFSNDNRIGIADLSILLYYWTV